VYCQFVRAFLFLGIVIPESEFVVCTNCSCVCNCSLFIVYSIHERHCFHSVAECTSVFLHQMFKYLHFVCLQDNPRLYLQLIDMGLQQNPLNEDNIISIIDQFLSRDTDPEQKVLFAQRKVEFLEDFGNDILRYVIVFVLLTL